ncbi:hypothetical protein TYRP_023168 [Tyrophagus putrescentiae]|nr:hypothetical protein TYRP_023168 [Tyrophagus putrescentiae]
MQLIGLHCEYRLMVQLKSVFSQLHALTKLLLNNTNTLFPNVQTVYRNHLGKSCPNWALNLSQFYDYHSPTSYSKEVIYSVLKSMTHEKPIRAWSIGRGLKRSSFEHLFGFGEMGSLAQLNSAQTASYFVPFGLAAVAAA